MHVDLVKQTLATIDRFTSIQACDVEVRFAGSDAGGMRALFGSNQNYVPQNGDSLGDRMNDAVSLTFDIGFQHVVVIGTDCPELTADHLADAFRSLHDSDVVVGPAVDGGYYLIGMRKHCPELFREVDWGTDYVLEQTLRNAQRINASVHSLSRLSDVDFPEDLISCRGLGEGMFPTLPRATSGVLSVIVPTLNEETNLAALLKDLQPSPMLEVIVVDGGSSDQTCERAEQAGVRIVRCGRGRGRQMNAGAAVARGDALLFLHADAKLPPDFEKDVRDALSGPNTGGAFRLRIDDRRWLLRLVELGANLRSRWLQLPYGDQAIFVRATTFFQLNGYRLWPLMEDYDFCKRLQKVGNIRLVPKEVTVSARRWNKLGIFKTTVLNQLIVMAFNLGVSTETLASWYRRK